jgi:hypothetical protein
VTPRRSDAPIALAALLAAVVSATGQPEGITLHDGDITIADPPQRAANLMPNSGFEESNAAGTAPAGWQEPDNLVATWTTDPEAPDRGKVIRIDTDVNQGQAYAWWADHFVRGVPLAKAPAKAPTHEPKYDTIAGLDGGFYSSGLIPIKPGKTYRVFVDAKGGIAKVFLFGYEESVPVSFGDEQPATQQVFRKARHDPELDARGRPIKYRLRYQYRSWFAVGGSNEWHTYTHKAPRHPTNSELTENVRFLRIQIYPYWPPGVYWFDNVRVYEAEDDRAPAPELDKDPPPPPASP